MAFFKKLAKWNVFKFIDQFPEPKIEENSKSTLGGLLTLLAPILVTGYVLYCYFQTPVLVSVSTLPIAKNVRTSLKCYCHDSCIFMSSCTDTMDQVIFNNYSSYQDFELKACRNDSNPWSFAIRSFSSNLEYKGFVNRTKARFNWTNTAEWQYLPTGIYAINPLFFDEVAKPDGYYTNIPSSWVSPTVTNSSQFYELYWRVKDYYYVCNRFLSGESAYSYGNTITSDVVAEENGINGTTCQIRNSDQDNPYLVFEMITKEVRSFHLKLFSKPPQFSCYMYGEDTYSSLSGESPSGEYLLTKTTWKDYDHTYDTLTYFKPYDVLNPRAQQNAFGNLFRSSVFERSVAEKYNKLSPELQATAETAKEKVLEYYTKFYSGQIPIDSSDYYSYSEYYYNSFYSDGGIIRNSSNNGFFVTDNITLVDYSENQTSIALSVLYINKEISSPWIPLLGLAGGTLGSIFGAFAVFMNCLRTVQEQFAKFKERRRAKRAQNADKEQGAVGGNVSQPRSKSYKVVSQESPVEGDGKNDRVLRSMAYSEGEEEDVNSGATNYNATSLGRKLSNVPEAYSVMGTQRRESSLKTYKIQPRLSGNNFVESA